MRGGHRDKIDQWQRLESRREISMRLLVQVLNKDLKGSFFIEASKILIFTFLFNKEAKKFKDHQNMYTVQKELI